MNEFLILFIIMIVFFILAVHIESRYSELTYVKSTVDGRMYLVRNRPDKQDAANHLANIKENLMKLLDYLKKHHPEDPRTQRLLNRFNPESISESMSDSQYTSFSVAKGEQIVFCIRSKDADQAIVDLNTMIFVAIHELAHIMTTSIGHNDEFWENMRYLLKKAIKIGIYHPIDYKQTPKAYCGIQITDSPLDHQTATETASANTSRSSNAE